MGWGRCSGRRSDLRSAGGLCLGSATWGCPGLSLVGVPPLGEFEERGAKSASPAIEARGFGGWPPTTGPRGGRRLAREVFRWVRGPSSNAGRACFARVTRQVRDVGASGLDSSGPADRTSDVQARAILRRSLPGTTLHPPPRADGHPGAGSGHTPARWETDSPGSRPGTPPRADGPPGAGRGHSSARWEGVDTVPAARRGHSPLSRRGGPGPRDRAPHLRPAGRGGHGSRRMRPRRRASLGGRGWTRSLPHDPASAQPGARRAVSGRG